MTEGTATQLQQGRRRIIERPRLTRLLDDSQARIKMLVAPAGYGKTTLARQWVSQGDRKSTWLQCTPAFADLAVMLTEVARASSEVGHSSSRTIERLSGTAEPLNELAILIDLLVEDLATWPAVDWLVLDDYHNLMASRAVEAILAEASSRTSINILITSRRRPTWATSRMIFYGSALELGARELAMDEREARKVLGQVVGMLPDVVASTGGWPAFIALAASSDDVAALSADRRTALYEFLANEVFSSVDGIAQRALLEISLAPRDNALLLRRLHPHDLADRIRDEALRVGVFNEGGRDGPELHPLLRHFLLKRCLERSRRDVEAAVGRVWNVLIEDQNWDDAFALLCDANRPDLLPELLEEALPSLLLLGRTMSLRRWLDYAATHDLDSPILQFAEAEVALRAGKLRRAEAIALHVVHDFSASPDLAARCFYIAGQSAHLQNREEIAIAHFREATRLARDRELQQEARRGELTCSVDLELDSAENVMREVVRNEPDDPAGIVNRANAQLIYELRFGDLRSLGEAALAQQVVDHVKDPIRRASFWGVYVVALGISANYKEARDVIDGLLDVVSDYRLDFALPYAYAAQGMVALGCKHYKEAADWLVRAELAAKDVGDRHALANADAIRSRLLLTQRRFREAADLLERWTPDGMTRGMAGEISACRAVALACLADSRYEDLAGSAAQQTRTVEARALVPLSHAIYKSATNASDLPHAARRALDAAAQTGCWDLLVCGYRAHPEFLLPLRHDERRLQMLMRVAERADDVELLHSTGLGRRGDGSLLSPREAEIHALLALGLTNREIAKRLVISEATVKLHVHRVLEKLGVRTRTAAAVKYQELRVVGDRHDAAAT